MFQWLDQKDNFLFAQMVSIYTLVGASITEANPSGLASVLTQYFAALKSPTFTGNPQAPNPAGNGNVPDRIATITWTSDLFTTIVALQAYQNELQLAGTRVLQWTSNGSFTVPSGVFQLLLRGRGAGGGGGAGGGNTSSQVSAGGGGGAGGYFEMLIPVAAGDVIIASFNPPGPGGINNGTSGGSAGVLTVFKDNALMVTANGGSGGINSTLGSVGQGGAGGSVAFSNGFSGISYRGGGGSYGIYVSGAQGISGTGGSAFGTIPGPQVTGINANGQNGGAPGQGGSGGLGEGAGGNGAAAELILIY